MFGHPNARDKVAYAGIVGVALFVCGLVGANRIQRPSPLVIQPAPVTALVSSPTQAPVVADVSAEVVVHVVGAVKKPGVQHLKVGQRVVDAVNAAGGATADADLDSVNLAAKAVDGSQIAIPHKGTPLPVGAIVPMTLPPNALTGKLSSERGPVERRTSERSPIESRTGDSSPIPSHRSGKKTPTAAVNINTASASELESLPGIGPATAQKILDYRSEHGRFGSVDELMAVKGIGEKKLEKMREWLRI